MVRKYIKKTVETKVEIIERCAERRFIRDLKPGDVFIPGSTGSAYLMVSQPLGCDPNYTYTARLKDGECARFSKSTEYGEVYRKGDYSIQVIVNETGDGAGALPASQQKT